MIGVNTVVVDDPRLTARDRPDEKYPLRVILDSKARTPPTARVFSQPGKTIIAAATGVDPATVKELEEVGAEVLQVKPWKTLVDLHEVMKELSRRQVTNILVEGGSTLLGAMFDGCMVDKVVAFIAPVIVGGQEAKSAVGGQGADRIGQALQLSNIRIEHCGKDVMVTGYLNEE